MSDFWQEIRIPFVASMLITALIVGLVTGAVLLLSTLPTVLAVTGFILIVPALALLAIFLIFLSVGLAEKRGWL